MARTTSVTTSEVRRRRRRWTFYSITAEGRTVEADFPIAGVGCHSFLLDDLPTAKKILSRIPKLVVMDKCKVSCVSPVVKAETKRGKEGARLTLFCPGSHHQFRYTDAYPAVQLHPVGDSHDSEVEELHDAAEGAADEERGRLAVGKPTEFCKQ
ncbi:uncharacterized protein LOC129981780 isoform X2 [Argiope bruennichi]|nr:uncharacterized protein LOC129981780 isoform X2 [Argiope bruennichi]